ncbi:carbohydrate ABC transporter permease [Microbacterium sp. F51-2R]|uniref:carbohydrate ABC transporter permease n=1 Tax=Microbacterium sp. F51-2R TaxID=3445777 RepID=UPI003F9FE376
MRKYTWREGLVEGGLGLIALVILFPVYILVMGAIRPAGDFGNRLLPPANPTLENFVIAWNDAGLLQALLASLVITALSIVLVVLITSAAAYPLARITATWSKAVYYAFMVGFLLPFQLALIPLYVAFRDLGLLGNPVSLVLLYAGLQAPFSLFLYTEFIRSVPVDYDEAAQLDGAHRGEIYFHVVLPMVKPITGTVIVLNAVNIWNDFYAPLLYLSGSDVKTLPLAIYQFTGEFGSQWELIFAGMIIAAIPVLAAFLIMQKAVFRGYASGLKG